MQDDWAVYRLPNRSQGASGLAAFLAAHSDRPVRLSAAALERLDAPLLQLLLSAARSWRERGIGFTLSDVPEPVAAGLVRLGVLPEMLGVEVRA